VPGNYLSDNIHRVELYNAGNRVADLSGWLLITRDYVFRFPKGSTLAAESRMTLAKQPMSGRPVDVVLFKHPNFMIKLYSRRVEGNYCALVDAGGRLLDAFYFAALPNVPFLPDSGACYINNKEQDNCYRLPPEQSPQWANFPVGYDPAVGFEQYAGQWRLISARSAGNLYPSTAFGEVSARYRNGSVLIRGATLFEDNLQELLLERSDNLQDFQTIGRIEVQGKSRSPTEYIAYDTTATPDRVYYYRFRSKDAPDLTIGSKIVEVETRLPEVEFRLDLHPERTADARQINIRFSSALTQKVLIKLLDDKSRERAILHQGLTYADTQHLLRLDADLPVGRYVIVAATENRRYALAFWVE